jgi:hypothetical protein
LIAGSITVASKVWRNVRVPPGCGGRAGTVEAVVVTFNNGFVDSALGALGNAVAFFAEVPARTVVDDFAPTDAVVDVAPSAAVVTLVDGSLPDPASAPVAAVVVVVVV